MMEMKNNDSFRMTTLHPFRAVMFRKNNIAEAVAVE
jgi:hypothetical protein